MSNQNKQPTFTTNELLKQGYPRDTAEKHPANVNNNSTASQERQEANADPTAAEIARSSGRVAVESFMMATDIATGQIFRLNSPDHEAYLSAKSQNR